MGIAESVAIGVPFVTALVYAAFFHPRFYIGILFSPIAWAGPLVFVVVVIWWLGYQAGKAGADQPDLVLFAVTTFGLLLLTLALRYIAHVSPRRDVDGDKPKDPGR